MWQVFEHPDFQGKSVVLTEGTYPSAEIFPFGDNQLSSMRKVDNVDVPRQDISQLHGAGKQKAQYINVESKRE